MGGVGGEFVEFPRISPACFSTWYMASTSAHTRHTEIPTATSHEVLSFLSARFYLISFRLSHLSPLFFDSKQPALLGNKCLHVLYYFVHDSNDDSSRFDSIIFLIICSLQWNLLGRT